MEPEPAVEIAELLRENKRLHKRIVTLEVQTRSLKHKIQALEEHIEQRAHDLFNEHVGRIKAVADQAILAKK